MKYRQHLESLVSGMLVVQSAYILACATKLVEVSLIQLVPLSFSVISLGSLLVHRVFYTYFEKQEALASLFAIGLVSGCIAYVFILATIHLWLMLVVLVTILMASFAIKNDFEKERSGYIHYRKRYYNQKGRT
ncbi:hypothetical protein FCV43_14760 [Vibrio genomosp. F6]|uniref:hypothetical protein n=1 Tax=Vibrio genomosp. F6 TaxID=723172 RepID=UPI0010BDCA07|nr:hypothetical protein [Vibrio genomosp. F6]TKF19944.1 hypothetical protein FCV43_14760 [Vibrio genomosp. F6]